MTTIDAITIHSPEHVNLAKFYQHTLQFPELLVQDQTHVGFDIDPYFGFDKSDRASERGNTVIWFRVDKIEEIYERVLSNGGTSVYEPNDEMSPGEILALCRDPEGNYIGLIKEN